MDLAAIQAQQERMSREGQVPPEGSYVAYATNLIKVVNTRIGRQLVFSFRVSDRITGTETVPANGYDLVSVFQKFEGVEETQWGTRDHAASAVAFLTRLGLGAYSVKATLDAANSASTTEKSAIILSNSVGITNENGEAVSLKGGPAVQLDIKVGKNGGSFGSVKKLPGFLA
jgi:hypothetical protein